MSLNAAAKPTKGCDCHECARVRTRNRDAKRRRAAALKGWATRDEGPDCTMLDTGSCGCKPCTAAAADTEGSDLDAGQGVRIRGVTRWAVGADA